VEGGVALGLIGDRFHVTTAYDLLRMKGVPLGKMDILNGAGGIQVEMVEKEE
jgi:hypothetical protein